MKTKLTILIALILLLAALAYITADFFFSGQDTSSNPFDYKLEDLRRSDSLETAYREIHHFTPGLDQISGITTDHGDRIIVSGQGGVEVYTPEGILISKLPAEGFVRCIAIAPGGKMYLGIENYIVIMDPAGKIVGRWNPVSEKSILTSIAVHRGNIFVADAGEKTVYRFDSTGRLINRIGEKDTLSGIPGFVVPSPWFDLGIGRDDELWVVNPGRHSLEAYTPDGKLISSWGKSSMHNDGFCGCCNPSNFAVLPDGSFVTSEKGIERIKVIRPSGELDCMVAVPSQFEPGTKGLDLAVDSHERVLVLDPWKKQVRIFVRE